MRHLAAERLGIGFYAVNDAATILGHIARMPDENAQTLHRVDQLRPTPPISRAELQVIMEQLAKPPRQGNLAKTAHGVIPSTAVLIMLWAKASLHL